MSTPDHRGKRTPFDLVRAIGTAAFAVFLVLSTAYPLVLGASAFRAWMAWETGHPAAQTVASLVPLVTLILLAVRFVVSERAERVARRRR